MKKVQVCCIIDDDPIFIYGTKRIMKEVDFAENIIVYNNGQEAVDGLKEIINIFRFKYAHYERMGIFR